MEFYVYDIYAVVKKYDEELFSQSAFSVSQQLVSLIRNLCNVRFFVL